jgi:hypothetical protein
VIPQWSAFRGDPAHIGDSRSHPAVEDRPPGFDRGRMRIASDIIDGGVMVVGAVTAL